MPPPATNPDAGLTGTEAPAETDAGPPRAGKAGAREPERRCIVTMERRTPGEMIRFVLSPDGVTTPDLAARLPGRGAWVMATREALELAVKKNAFSRAFKTQAKPGPDLLVQVEQLLVRRILDQLGMAKRAGDLILGFEQVREAIRQEAPGCLIEASDGSLDQRGKVLGLLRAAHGPDLDEDGVATPGNNVLPPVIACFSAEELGMALGRDRVIHACLKHGRIAQAWMGELARLSGFRRVWLADWPPTHPSLLPTGGGAAGRKIEDTQARVSGGDPPDTPAATEVSE